MTILNFIDYLVKSRLESKEPQIRKKFEVGWTKTDIKSLTFLHTEASVRVQDTIRDHHEISKKAFSLLLLLVTISSFLGGYLMSAHTFDTLDAFVIIALVVCSVSIYFLSRLIKPNKFRAPGRVPSKVMVDKIYNDEIKPSDRYKLIVYQELLNCQAQIELNQYYNTVRLTIIDFIVRLILISFITLAILMLVIKAIS